MGVTPASVDELAGALRAASAATRAVTPIGGGTKSRAGRTVAAGELLSTGALTGIVEHIPAELTVTVMAGTPTAILTEQLAAAGQWWPQADPREGATVGGTVAAGASGRRRLRYGPVRDSVLEVVLVTGDGRTVRGGGPTVKGVAGYDLPRLLTGSRGTLGVIAQVTLKLTPLPADRAWFTLQGTLAERRTSARTLLRDVRRPSAVLLSGGTLSVELVGVAADVVAPAGFAPAAAPPEPYGGALVDVGVPPAQVGAMVSHLEARGLPYLAECGVGACRVAIEDPGMVAELRGWATELGGHAVVADAPDVFRAEPWGAPPPAGAIMERMRTAFDPAGILSPAHRPAAT